MMKQSIFLVLFILIFNACAENGNTLQPNSEPIKMTKTTETNTSMKMKETKIKKVSEIKNETIEKSNFFILSEETKHTLSGAAIILIGIMILI